MHWGVRRFQKKDGSLTSAGKKRYDDTDSQPIKKSKHRLKLEEKYRKGGLSEKDAEIAASKRIKKEKILAAAAGITVAAATAYVINKNLKERCDSIIKSGKTLQRIQRVEDNGKLYDTFFAANNRSDKVKYAGKYGFQAAKDSGHAHLMNLKVDKDIKVAGTNKARQVFERLYKNDSNFKKVADMLGQNNSHGNNKANGDMKKMYENFNSYLSGKHVNTDPTIKKFYSALKAEGYGAIKDMNDAKFSGYKAKNPLLVFDHKGKISIDSIVDMDTEELFKRNKRYQIEEGIKNVAKKAAIPIAAITMFKMAKDDTVKNHKAKQRSFINEYRKEHPNTKLNDEEIAKLM